MIRYITVLAFGLLFAGVTLMLFTLPTPPESAASSATSANSAEQTSDENMAQRPVTGTLLRNVRLLENGQLGGPRSILMQDGMITGIHDAGEEISTPDDVIVIDGAGGTLLPGLIDAHTHSYGSSLDDALRFGVTTHLDMFADPGQLPMTRMAREEPQATRQADLFSAGMLATAPGGHGTQYGIQVDTLTAPEQARDWVRARKAEGSDYIKLAYIPNTRGFPSIDRPTAAAVIAAAHDEGLMALAHISTQQAAMDMIEDDIDGLVHIFADEPASDALLQLAVEREVFVIATLAVIESINSNDDDSVWSRDQLDQMPLSPMQEQTLSAGFGQAAPGFRLDTALENVRRLHEAGVPVLAGSDAPNPGTAQGLSLHREMQLLVRAGMSEQEALNAASELPAALFNLEGRGVIKVGSRADLIVVDGNPLEDISVTQDLQWIFKNGFLADRSLETPPSLTILDTEVLGDFEDGMQAPEGFGWAETDDTMANGKSEVQIERVPEAEGHALKVNATVRPGFPYPWAGGAIMSNSGHDVSAWRAVRFDVRGTAGTYRLMAFNEGAMGIPPTKNFAVNEDWQTITVALEDLKGAHWGSFIGFAWVAGPTPGESTIYLDNVRLVK